MDFASKTARRDVEEQAASAQTADPVEDAPKASERAVGLRFCSLKSCRRQLWSSSQNRKQMCLAPCTRQDLNQRVRRLAIDEMETAQQAVKTLTALWLEELKAGRSDEANALKQEVKEAEAKLEKAEQKYKDAKASVQAGPEQAGASACAVVAVAFGLQPPAWSSCVFARSTVVAFWGHALLSARIPSSLSFTALACNTSGSGRGS